MLTANDVAEVARLVAIDAETTGHATKTGLEVAKLPKGMRLPGVIIQLGCVELLREGDSWRTGETWETLVNPDGPVSPYAMRVHGVHPAVLKNAPRFLDIREPLEAFIGNAPLIAHAAKNEIDFLNYEMRRCRLVGWDQSPYDETRFLDTQLIARDVFPGAPTNLDAICDRLWIDRSDRFQHHGALLDAMLTAEAFIRMTNGSLSDEPRVLSF